MAADQILVAASKADPKLPPDRYRREPLLTESGCVLPAWARDEAECLRDWEPMLKIRSSVSRTHSLMIG
jgi:hypothetical protein